MNNVTKKMLTTLSVINNALANSRVLVKFGANDCAYMDGSQRVVEIRPLDFRKKANYEVAIGNAVHEALHHIYTDFDDFSLCNTPFHQGITNSLEDGMIETLGAKVFPGIRDIMVKFLKRGIEQGWWINLSADQPERLFIMYVRIYMSVHRQGMQLMSPVLANCRTELRKIFNETQMSELNRLLDEGKSTVTTTDNRLLAWRILEWLDKQQDEQQDSDSQPDDSNGDSGGDSQPDDSNGDSGGDSQPDDSNGESGGDSQPDDSNGDSGGDSQPDDSNGDSGGDSQPDDSNGDSGGDSQPDDSNGDSGGDSQPDDSSGDSGGDSQPDDSNGDSGGDSQPDDSNGDSGGDSQPDDSSGDSGGDSQPDDSNGDSGGDSQPDDSNGDSGGDSQPDDSNGDSGGDSQPDDSNGDSGGDSQPDDSNGDSGGDSQPDDSNGDSGGDSQNSTNHGSSQPETPMAISRGRLNVDQFQTVDPSEAAKEFLSAQPMTDAIDDELQQAEMAYRTTQFAEHDEEYGLKKMVNSIQSKCFKPLSLIVRSRKWADTAISKRGTDIDESRLYRAQSDGKVFKEEAIIKGENAAISLLLDNSGSMRMPQEPSDSIYFKTAVPSVFGISKALERLKVPTEIFAFSSSGLNKKLIPLKGFKEKTAPALDKNGMIYPSGGTPTAEAICAAIPSLALRPERKKVMIVITDGESNHYSNVESAIELANKFGITVEFILIEMPWSEGFEYDRHRTINNIRELPKALEHICENLV